MSIIAWDAAGSHKYSTGVDMVALYVKNTSGVYQSPVAFNGVTALNESPSGAESNKIYADNQEYLNLVSKEEFSCTLEAYQMPNEFKVCEGITTCGLSTRPHIFFTQQPRRGFGLVYRTLNGDDSKAADPANQNCTFHVVYNCKAGVSSKDHATVNDSPEAATFSWEISTSKETETVNGTKYEFSHIEIPCNTLTTTQFDALKGLFYGTAGTTGVDGKLPTIAQINSALYTQ